MKRIRILLLFTVFLQAAFAQQSLYSKEDKTIFDAYAKYIQPFQQKTLEEVMERTALFFQGTPYVAHTLDLTPDEIFVINLRELDCVTFVENVMALSLTAKSHEISFEKFMDELREIRYRKGNIEAFDSRLHYTSDWMFENEKRGAIENISRKLGGKKEKKHIDFMTQHPASYDPLKNNPQMVRRIAVVEDSINARGGFYYLPKAKIASVASRIPHMSIIAFTTSISGLDTSHVGLAYKKNGKLRFIHASSVDMKVKVDEKPLVEYCAGKTSCTGIIVAVLKDR